MRLRMLCLSGFELYSRWVPLRVVKVKIKSLFKNVSFMRGGYRLKLIANLVQITKHVEFYLNPA